MKKPDHSPEPKELLEAFVASGRSEGAFATLVEDLGRLVYSSALRRTGDKQLAEEITQNVFAVLARKAEALCRHPALEAWLLKTTRLQAASAMRAEQRRNRRMAAMTSEITAQQSSAPNQMDNTASWKDAVPFLDQALDRLPERDQGIIVQRFYQGKKFREIAAANGQTEGACKKRVERALKKLSRTLNAHGVTLSTTLIASALGTKLAQSAPAQSAVVLGNEALAASASISTTTLIANSIQTMSKLKTIAITVAAVILVSAIPYTQQRAEAGRIQSELQALRESRLSAAIEPIGKLTALGKREPAAGRNPGVPRTANGLLASLDAPVNHRAFIQEMVMLEGTPDPLAQGAVDSRIQRMSLEEQKDLLRTLKAYPLVGYAKEQLATRILNRTPDMSPREKLEALMVWGSAIGGQNYMREWAASDPDAAMEWFWEKRAAGELDRGLGDGQSSFYSSTLDDLLWAVAGKNPVKALGFYSKLPGGEIDGNGLRKLAMNIAKGDIESGEQTYYRIMLETHGGDDRKMILRGILGAYAGEERFDEGMAIVDEYIEAPEEREEHLNHLFQSQIAFWKIGGGLDWLVASSPEEEAPAVIRRMIQKASFTWHDETLGWADRQAPGVIRDQAYAGWVEQQLDSTYSDDFPRVLPVIEKIENPVLRGEVRQLIRTKWDEQDKEKLSPYIPAAVLDKLKNL